MSLIISIGIWLGQRISGGSGGGGGGSESLDFSAVTNSQYIIILEDI